MLITSIANVLLLEISKQHGELYLALLLKLLKDNYLTRATTAYFVNMLTSKHVFEGLSEHRS